MTKGKLIVYISIPLLLLILVAIGISPLIIRKYENEKLGVRLEIPGNWDLEVTERFLSLILKLKGFYSGQESVSIVILANFTPERNLVGRTHLN